MRLLPSTVIATKAAVVQRDGDIVEADTGFSDPQLQWHQSRQSTMWQCATVITIGVDEQGSRWHCPVIPRRPWWTSLCPPLRPMAATTVLDGATVSLLWAGDTNISNSVVANGSGNDTNLILGTILTQVSNTEANVNYRLRGTTLPT